VADWSGRTLHFVGIGGAGMSGLALVARALGAAVTGSDRAESSYVERLRAAGIEPAIGHDAAHVPEAAELVVSTAIAEDNPELRVARERGARVVHRGELLAEVARLRRSIAVAGAHGKTTTAAMAVHALERCGRAPSYLVGGELRSSGTNAVWGAGEWIVVEADESDRSFLALEPEVAVVTNVELDHHATYRSERELERAFADFAAQSGRVVAWEGVALPRLDVSYGDGEAAGLRAERVELLALGSRFEVAGARCQLAVPGVHNVWNALGAIAACREAGLSVEEAASALADFRGTGRRFEPRGRAASGALVFDDYAHHPTEVAATLRAARGVGDGRLVACFQPHLYSRTQHLARAFGRALALADLVVVLDVYPARERAEDYPGVSGYLVAAEAASAARGRPVLWLPRIDEAAAFLGVELRPDDVLVTLGAGDVHRVAEALAAGAG
jgi:UDP-N-acetylmuramate--alanine ligase